MTPARRLHHRPGRPTPSGPRPRSMRPTLKGTFRRVVREAWHANERFAEHMDRAQVAVDAILADRARP